MSLIIRRFAFIILAFILLISQPCCNAVLLFNCIEVGGKITTESRKTAEFSGIELGIPADVFVSQGTPQELKITAKRGVLEQIVTEVEEGILKIEYDTCVNNPDSIKIYITAQNFNRLQMNGSGSISTVYGITAENLELKINGSGDINVEANAEKVSSKINGSGEIALRGSAKEHEIKINGSGDINAFEAVTEKCNIKVNGSGDCMIYVNQLLEVKVNGSGDVIYKGSPEISTSINGSGNIRKK